MAIDRNLLEQEALALLNRGQVEKALNRYQALLRADPRDRRIRQKVAELLLRMGRRGEGERLLREVADSLVNEGQHRAAVALYKQLLDLSPDDGELEAQLGVCYATAGFPTEARRTLESAVKHLSRTDPARAVASARQLMRLAPGETAVVVMVAELMESAGQRAEALESWRALAADAKRRGRADDQVRFLEQAVKSASEDVDLLCEAAEARFAMGDPKAALAHVQKAYQVEKQSARVLALLARALEEGGMAIKARPVWIQAARQFEAEGAAAARADALTRALAIGPDDPDLRAQLGEAASAAARAQLRLDDKPWAQPKNDSELRVVIRARTLARYGFPDRALDVLRQSDAASRFSGAVRIALAELLAERGDSAGALAELREVSATADPDSRDQLRTRMEMLGEVFGDSGMPEEIDDTGLEELDEGALEPTTMESEDEESIEDEPTVDTPRQGEILVTPPQLASPPPAVPLDPLESYAPEVPDLSLPAAARSKAKGGLGIKVGVKKITPAPSEDEEPLAAPPEGMLGDDDDFPTSVLSPEEAGIAAIRLPMSADAATVADVPSFLDALDLKPDFSDLLPGSPSMEFDEELESETTNTDVMANDASLDEARALVAVGMFADARDRLFGRNDLPSIEVLARALWGIGDVGTASDRLRGALADSGERDPGYLDALWTLAQLDARLRKSRSALRLIGELSELDPDFRTREVADLKRGVEMLLRRPGN